MDTDLVAESLRCEYLTDPLGVDVARPRLSWTLRAVGRARRQSAYQVLVASAAERLTANQGDLWDSGRVDGNRSVGVIYEGAPLESGQRCWWAVRVWDANGRASAYSAPSWWEMGLLRREDWHGAWIDLGDDASAERRFDAVAPRSGDATGGTGPLDLVPSPYLRRAFRAAGPVRRARLYATARGLYEARLNGQRVGDTVLAPGWTDYHARLQYQTYDVTHLVREGENALGAILGAGWYCGYLGFAGRNKYYGERPALLLHLSITYEDGTTETIASDGSWRATTGPILSSDLLMGETYDARRALRGWDQPGFDDAGWAAARATDAERDGARALLVADRAEPVRVLEEREPHSVARLDADTQVVDMGQNMVGWVRLRLRGAARGAPVRLRFAEALNPDGSIYTANLRHARATDTYIPIGQESGEAGETGETEETFEPRFTFHGFRYVEVTGYPGALAPENVTGVVVGSDTPPAGTFSCSSPLVNQLQQNIVWGQRGNFLSVPTDCPQRDERLGWTADAQIFARTASCNADVAAFFTKWLTDVADAQQPDGAFPDVAPLIPADDRIDLSHGAPAWGNAGVIIPWTLYQVYGDTRLIERHYEGMARWLDYIGAANPDGRWVNGRGNDFGDWLALDGTDPANAFGSATPKDLLATAYYAYDARLMARMARAIGRVEDAEGYDALFDTIKAAFNRAYVDGDGRILGDTQTGYVLALHMDLLPEGLRAGAARRLVELIEARGWRLTTGFVGVGYLCPVLTDAGYADVAYRLLLNDTYPSWGYSIRQGATTIWERWDGWTQARGFEDPGMNSFNHYALGSVGEWLYRHVAGIDLDPARPGYERIIVHPRPSDRLPHARATYRSVRGAIAVKWRIADGAYTLRVSIPANTTATVYMPSSDIAAITEGDSPARAAEGVRFARTEGEDAVFEVGSGDYTFRCPWHQA